MILNVARFHRGPASSHKTGCPRVSRRRASHDKRSPASPRGARHVWRARAQNSTRSGPRGVRIGSRRSFGPDQDDWKSSGSPNRTGRV